MRDDESASKRPWRVARFPIGALVAGAVMVAAASVGSATTWTQQREFTSSTAELGGPIALSGDGNTALVGGNTGYTTFTNVYARSGTVWKLQERLSVAVFAMALSGDGNTALIGPYVFQRSGIAWTETHELIPNAYAGPVALSGDGNSAVIAGSGGLYMFRRSGTSWTQQEEVTGFGGRAVAISSDGSTILADGPSGASFPRGAVTVFHWSGAAWTQQQILTDKNSATDGSYFGVGVSLNANGTVAFIGGDPPYWAANDAAFLFTRTGTTWAQQQTLSASGTGDGEYATVALSASGTVAMVALLGPEDPYGFVTAFQCSATHCARVQAISVKNQPNGYGNGFGGSVSLSNDGTTALIGTGDGSDPTDAAWVFTSG